MQNKSSYLLSGLLSAIIWGFFAFPLRNLQNFSAEQILYFRVFMALTIVWLFIALFRKQKLIADFQYLVSVPKPQLRSLIFQVIGSAVLLMLNWYSFIYAINHISIKSAAFAYMVCPLITAFGAYLFLKEQLSRVQFLALFFAAISILLLARGAFVDVLWSAVIASFYAFFLIIQRRMQGLDKLNVMAVQLALASLIMLPLFLVSGVETPNSVFFWQNILLIASIFTVIPLFLNLYALVGIPSSTMGIIIYINPIIAFAVAFIYFDEQVNLYQVLAYSLLLFAVFLFNWQMIKDMLIFRRK